MNKYLQKVTRLAQSTKGKRASYKEVRKALVEAVLEAKKNGVRTMEIVKACEPHFNKAIIFNILKKGNK